MSTEQQKPKDEGMKRYQATLLEQKRKRKEEADFRL